MWYRTRTCHAVHSRTVRVFHPVVAVGTPGGMPTVTVARHGRYQGRHRPASWAVVTEVSTMDVQLPPLLRCPLSWCHGVGVREWFSQAKGLVKAKTADTTADTPLLIRHSCWTVLNWHGARCLSGTVVICWPDGTNAGPMGTNAGPMGVLMLAWCWPGGVPMLTRC